MKLKTLKDLEDFSKHQTGNHMLYKVKQLAIEWVKNCEYRGKSIIACEKDGYRCDACQRTMEMNNITEEDLK